MQRASRQSRQRQDSERHASQKRSAAPSFDSLADRACARSSRLLHSLAQLNSSNNHKPHTVQANMASAEPLFDPSLMKKKKGKKADLTKELDALDEPAPAAAPAQEVATESTTAATDAAAPAAETADEENMFADLKKKKKSKKLIPMDLDDLVSYERSAVDPWCIMRAGLGQSNENKRST